MINKEYYKNLQYDSLENETWKSIPNYENFYEISNLGRVRSISETKIDKNGIKYKKRKRILKQSFTTTGYLKVTLRDKEWKVHRLVGLVFIPIIENKDFINHKDLNPLNNCIENLEWCTHQENVTHAILNNAFTKIKHFTEEEKQEIIFLYREEGYQASEIAKKFNVTNNSIRSFLGSNKIKHKQFVRKTKYNIDLFELCNLFKEGIRNVDLAKKFNCSRTLIGIRKYQFKKGELNSYVK